MEAAGTTLSPPDGDIPSLLVKNHTTFLHDGWVINNPIYCLSPIHNILISSVYNLEFQERVYQQPRSKSINPA